MMEKLITDLMTELHKLQKEKQMLIKLIEEMQKTWTPPMYGCTDVAEYYIEDDTNVYT